MHHYSTAIHILLQCLCGCLDALTRISRSLSQACPSSALFHFHEHQVIVFFASNSFCEIAPILSLGFGFVPLACTAFTGFFINVIDHSAGWAFPSTSESRLVIILWKLLSNIWRLVFEMISILFDFFAILNQLPKTIYKQTWSPWQKKPEN